MTEVVNINNKDSYDIYIGRSGKGLEGPFGNYVEKGQNRYERVDAFREYFLDRIAKDEVFRQSIEDLRGKTLGCFCMPLLCHGTVIVEYLEGITADQQIADYVARYVRKKARHKKLSPRHPCEPDIFG